MSDRNGLPGLGDAVDVCVDMLYQIPVQAPGKFRYVVSHVDSVAGNNLGQPVVNQEIAGDVTENA